MPYKLRAVAAVERERCLTRAMDLGWEKGAIFDQTAAMWAAVELQAIQTQLAVEKRAGQANTVSSVPPLDSPALNCGGCNDRSCLECYAQETDDAQ